MYINTFNFDDRHLIDLCLGIATMFAIAVLHHIEQKKIEATRVMHIMIRRRRRNPLEMNDMNSLVVVGYMYSLIKHIYVHPHAYI